MSDPLRIPETQIGPIGSQQGSAQRGAHPAEAGAFADALNAAQSLAGNLKFSAHAMTRIQSRAVPFGTGEAQRLQDAVAKAANKGARDSLVMMDDAAYIVSIANRTVVTVVDKEKLKENVFTNIDSAVIA